MPHRPLPGPPAPLTDPLARQIAAYWVAHPQAGDTAKGIREWWLSDTLGWAVNEEQVRQALQTLLDEGVAEEVAGWGGQASRFRLVMAADELARRLADGPAPH